MAKFETAQEYIDAGYTFFNYGGNGDCYPYEILRTNTKKSFVVRQMNAVADIENGHEYFGQQKYIITPNENAPEEIVSIRKRGFARPGSKVSLGWGFSIAQTPVAKQNPSF